jgi:hypothetical protein
MAFDNADFALRVSLIARISAQFTHEIAYGMWNPDYCAADADYGADRFIEAIEPHLERIKARIGRMRDNGQKATNADPGEPASLIGKSCLTKSSEMPSADFASLSWRCARIS